MGLNDPLEVRQENPGGPPDLPMLGDTRRRSTVQVDVAFATYPRTAPDVVGDRAVFLKDGQGMRRVFLRDMLYLEADGNYVELHLRNGRAVLRNSMAEVLKALPPDVFFMVNRSQAVNLLLVDHIGTDEVGIGKIGFTLSRRYRDELVSHLPIISGR